MLRLCRNHSAFNSHNFPRTCTTTYPYVAAPPQPNALTRKAQGFGNYLVSSGCTYGLVTVSFHSICIEVSFDAVSAQSFARPLAGLLATHLAIVFQYIQPTCRDCSLHVPRRLRKVQDSNLRCLKERSLLRFTSLSIAPAFVLSANLPCLRSLRRDYIAAFLTLTASCWSSLTTLHLSFMISPDAIILCILCFG